VIRILALLLVFSYTAKANDPIVVLAEVKKQSFAGQMNCSEGHICMSVWIRYHLKIKKVLSDIELPKRIKAIRIQHSEYRDLTKEPILFVLNKIDDPEIRDYRGADFAISEMDEPETIYCFENNLESYGLDSEILNYSRPNKCMSERVIEFDKDEFD